METRSNNISEGVLNDVLEGVKQKTSALMLFGSYARGDNSKMSDIDVLELAERRSRPYQLNRINVSVYDEPTLLWMAKRGSLFVLHLRLEGVLIRDPYGKLASCLAAYAPPLSYEPYRRSLREIANLLDVSNDDYIHRWRSYNELAFFLLRSALYAKFAESGKPTFSLKILQTKIDREDVTKTFQKKNSSVPDFAFFAKMRNLVEEFLGTKAINQWQSVEALITNVGDKNPLILAFGLRLLGKDNLELSYDMLAFPDY